MPRFLALSLFISLKSSQNLGPSDYRNEMGAGLTSYGAAPGTNGGSRGLIQAGMLR